MQAPAGSGKTELLVQRLLSLLATVDDPSEILAITFTRKASQEMRERLLGALQQASVAPDPSALPVAQMRRALAEQVLRRDRALGWNLIATPDRLSIDTFDAFCARIVTRANLATVASEGALGRIEDDPGDLYREAAIKALGAAEVADAAREVLAIAANRVESVVELMAGLLARRAQWLGAALDTSERGIERLAARLRHAADAAIARLDQQWRRDDPDGQMHATVGRLLAHTAQTLGHTASNDKQRAIAPMRASAAIAWPGLARGTSARTPTLADLPVWNAVAAMLLTGDDAPQLRKPGGVNKTAGFPTPADKTYADIDPGVRSDRKAEFIHLLEAMQATRELVACLAELQHVPTLAAIAEHETALRATLILLRQAAIELLVMMRERGVADFSAVMTAALTALRENRADVLANLDAQLRHVLVDEVQDTNPAQFDLLAVLTADWARGDGRTLFLVGDPMQSIYMFRDADVSLFRRAQQVGVGPVRPVPLTLTANYRSQPEVVHWVNRALALAFTRGERGLFADDDSIAFVGATATRPGSDDEGQNQIDATSAEAEAREVVEAISWRLRAHSDERIAVLARTRGDASVVIEALQAHGIAFSATEFARWSARERVRDLTTLTDAVLAPWDRVALYAMLRSPWVGLRLDTLVRLSAELADRPAHPAWRALNNDWTKRLDSDEAARVALAYAALSVGAARAWLASPAERVEAVWRALDGPALLQSDGACAEVRQFFEWLDDMAPGGLLPPRQTLRRALEEKRRSFASTVRTGDAAIPARVELLTIHKAKGLEWDHVFVVGCDRAPRADARSLASWRFQPLPGTAPGAGRSFAIAARDTRRQTAGSVYDFLARFNRSSRLDESKRQLYVAVTRAKRTLTLSRQAAHCAPPYGSFAYWLGWQAAAAPDNLADSASTPASTRLCRAASLDRRVDLPAPLPPDSVQWPVYAADAVGADTNIDAESRHERAVGIVGHRLFEGLALAMRTAGGSFVPPVSVIQRALHDAGADRDSSNAVAARLAAWFAGAAQRDNVRLLFSPAHRHAAQEVELAVAEPGEGTLRVDHTFVTADGACWVVDYKFAEPHNADAGSESTDAWVDRQTAQYRDQLQRYRRALAQARRIDPAAITCAIYFPWLDRLVRLA
ncbi:MAG: UvrD-helicase domain-containing protein [Burkholderiales bacterium]|nr:UvrD-helicase domain-containing protein [Burkholderiales bacterium]